MKTVRLVSLALVVSLGAMLVPGLALAFGIGVEGGGISVQRNGGSLYLKTDLWTPSGGIIVENSFPIRIAVQDFEGGVGSEAPHPGEIALFLDVWADVQTPIEVNAEGGSPTWYVPIDLGLRLAQLPQFEGQIPVLTGG